MKPSQMKPAQLKEARLELQRRLRDTLSPSRISSLTDNSVMIEGGSLPATYNHDPLKGALTIWGRAGRYSGGHMTVDELAEAERVCMNFFFELHETVEEE